jgi:hypothetical protein
MPLKLAQGITLGVDIESRTPTIPTLGGVLSRLENVLEKTHVETENINGINYITEGFLKRHSFKFKKKSSSIWKKIGKIMAATALVVGMAVATVVTAGGAAVIGTIAGAIAGATGIAAGTLALGSALIIGSAAVAAGAIAGVTAATQEIGYAVVRIGAKKRLNGRSTVAPSGYKIVDNEDARQLTKNFEDRIIIKDDSKNDIHAILCPEYTVNQPYYNQVFTGNEHLIETDVRQSNTVDGFSGEHFFENEDRHFYISGYLNKNDNNTVVTSKVIAVPDNTPCIGVDNVIFRSRAGEAEEAWRYRCVGEEVTALTEDSY